MPHFTILLYRVSPDWTLAVRRLFQRSNRMTVEVVELESMDDLQSRLEESSVALVVMELTDRDAQWIISSLERVARDYPAARTVVVGPHAARSWEWIMREAGAVWATFSPREIRPLSSIALRQAAVIAKS